MRQGGIRWNMTNGLVAVLAAAHLLAWLGLARVMASALALFTGQVLFRPWSLATYPLATTSSANGAIFVAFMLLWLYWLGESLERDLGSRGYLLLFVLATIAMGLGFALFGSGALFGPGLPIAVLTCAWAGKNRNAPVRLYMLIPVPAWVIAAIAVVTVALGYGAQNPILGAVYFAILVGAWLWGGRGLVAPRIAKSDAAYRRRENAEFIQFSEEVRRREKERAERERLRKLFEESTKDEE